MPPDAELHIFIVVDEAYISRLDWDRIRREAVERQSLLSLLTCSGKNAKLVLPAQPGANVPVLLPIEAGRLKVEAGIGAAVADRVLEAEALIATVANTQVRVIGDDRLEFEVWDALHDAPEISLFRYNAQGKGPFPLVSPKQPTLSSVGSSNPEKAPRETAPAHNKQTKPSNPAAPRQPMRPNPHSLAGRIAAANNQAAAAATTPLAPTVGIPLRAAGAIAHTPSPRSAAQQPPPPPMRPNPHSLAGRMAAAANNQAAAAATTPLAPTVGTPLRAAGAIAHTPSPRSAAQQPPQANLRRKAAIEQLKRLEIQWKITEVLWVLFWAAVVVGTDSMIINAFADPFASDPSDLATRFGYNLFTIVLADLGVLVPALICRSVVDRLRDRKRAMLRK
jgi:hypothetical protein